MFCPTLHIYILVITTHLLVTGIGWFKKISNYQVVNLECQHAFY